MKKLWGKVLSIVCACVLLAVVSWGIFSNKKIQSAYDIAVENGFKGTEQEWLASLQGADGKDGEDAPSMDINQMYDEAVKRGEFEGTFVEFLKQTFNVDIKEGNDAAQIAENAMSVVSVVCGFPKKVSTGFATSYYEYPASVGSGVIVDLDKKNGNALIVTNYHVIYNKDVEKESDRISERIYIYTCGSFVQYDKATGKDIGQDGIQATYVGGAMAYDIALLQISGSEHIKNSDVTEAKIGDSETVQMGEKVFPIGNPSGDGIAVTSGIISFPSETIVLDSLDGTNEQLKVRVMRTDAAINPGNSGGGLFNASGELIGIVNAKSMGSSVDNVGYAIPINLAKGVWENILANGGYFTRALMGITVTIADTNANYQDGKLTFTDVIQVVTEEGSGTAILDGSPAYGKLKHNDIITGATIKSGKTGEETTYVFSRQYHLLDAFLTVRLGDTVYLEIERNGNPQTVEFKFNDKKYFSTPVR